MAPSTTFTLTSLDGTRARDLAKRLVVTPAISLTVVQATDTIAALRPAAPLRQGQIYRFELRQPDGSTVAAWAVQAAWPLGVSSTLPADQTTNVPRDTGIEITFDQVGVRLSDVQERFSILPAVKGAFEVHGRTIAFVPAKPLAGSTLYTVTVRHGLPLPGTGMTLEQDAIVRFETTGDPVSWVHLTFNGPLFDAGTQERAAIRLNLDAPEGVTEKVTKAGVKVHRLSGLTAAMDAYARVRTAPDWAQRSSTVPVKTSALPLVLQGTLPLRTFAENEDWTKWFQLPKTLPAGWYVVTMTHAGLSRQTVLQVTDLAAFTMVSRTRSLAWVNDLRTDKPVAGARVSLGGKAIGTTDAQGLVVATSPAVLVTAGEEDLQTFAVVRSGSRALFVPLSREGFCYYCGDVRADAWWHLLTTDRSRYRVSDTINAWGVVRDRDTGKVPASVTIRLTPNEQGGAQPAVAVATAKPDASGAFLAHLSFSDLPPGEYLVSVDVGSTTIASTWVNVGPIAKPAWQIALTTPKHAVLSGSMLPLTAVGTFFEGTPVAGADLRLTGNVEEDEGGKAVVATTDADGRTAGSVLVRLGSFPEEQWNQVGVAARANEPEEGDVSADLSVAVFRSTAILDSHPTLKGTTLTLAGDLHDVAFDRFDEPGMSLWDVDPRGAPRAKGTISIAVTEVIPVIRQSGTRYDFITKQAIPTYTVTERKVSLGTRTAVTAADGSFRLTMTVTGGDRSYEVRASYVDEASRRIATDDTAWPQSASTSYREPWLSATGTDDVVEYAVGETVRVQFRDGLTKPPVARYLFAVMARGLRAVTVQNASRFSVPFTAGLVPAAQITGVRFNGTGYEVALSAYQASLRQADRKVDVQLTPDQDRYAPGGRVTVAVRTLDAAGRPIAASVFVRAVDEKLFTIGAAQVDDPLAELYSPPGTGLLTVGWSHVNPEPGGDGRGDATGGGDGRDDFRDWLVARIVTTGADGRGSLSFDLSDDLTSWRVLASAVTTGLGAGQGSARIPVSLPFFADAVVAAEYLSADRPIVRVRAYGTDLTASDPVSFRVSSDTLPMSPVIVQGKAFEPVEVALPTLSAGNQRLRVQVTTGSGATYREDTIIRTFTVVDTRTIRQHTASVPLAAGTTVGGGAGLTSVVLVDAGRGRVVPLLRELASSDPFRADRALAAAIARDLLADQFGIPMDAGLPDTDLLAFQTSEGVALLPYSSIDLELSAMAALSGDRHLNHDQLAYYFQNVEGSQPTDQALFLLLGRAAVGQASLGEVAAAAARTDLSGSQRITVALAALGVGDETLAKQLERDLLARYGERLGPWVRLNLGAAELTAVGTARLAIVAAAIGDPIAADMDAEVATHPPKDTVVDLERAIAAKYWAQRMPKTTAVAAVTLDGQRSEVTITAGEPARFYLTPAQRAGMRIDPISGSVLVVSSWDGPLAAADLTPPTGQSITRSVTPAGMIDATDTVAVTFKVTLGPNADDGCWRVTDFAPSGLMPVATEGRWVEADESSVPGIVTPWRVVGQRVDFCVERNPRLPTVTLRYLARVVTPGTYRWEQAVLQSPIVPEQGIVLPAFDVTIKGLGS